MSGTDAAYEVAARAAYGEHVRDQLRAAPWEHLSAHEQERWRATARRTVKAFHAARKAERRASR